MAAALPTVSARLKAALEAHELTYKPLGGCIIVGPVPLLRPALVHDMEVPQLHPAGRAVLEALDDSSVAIVGSCGPSRMGKSAKLSTIAARLADPEHGHTYDEVYPEDRLLLFPTSDRGEVMTQGADALFIFRPGAPSVMVIDTEGSGDRGSQYDLKLHVLAVLQAKMMLLHCQTSSRRGAILDALAAYCKAGASVAATASDGDKRIAVLVSDCGTRTTAEEERAKTFDLEAEARGEMVTRNAFRKAVALVFRQRSVFILPPPTAVLRTSGRSMDEVLDEEIMPLVLDAVRTASVVPGLELDMTGARLAESMATWCDSVAAPEFDAANPTSVAAVARRISSLQAETQCIAAATEELTVVTADITDRGIWWDAARVDACQRVRDAAEAAVVAIFRDATAEEVAAARLGAEVVGDVAAAVAALEASDPALTSLVAQVDGAIATSLQRVVDEVVTQARAQARVESVHFTDSIAAREGVTVAGLDAIVNECQERMGTAVLHHISARRGGATDEEVMALAGQVGEMLEDSMDLIKADVHRVNQEAIRRTCRTALFVAERLALELAHSRAAPASTEARDVARADLEALSTTTYSSTLPAAAERAAASAMATSAPDTVRLLWSSEAATALAEVWRTSGVDRLPHARELVGDDVRVVAEYGPSLARIELGLSCTGLETAQIELERIHTAVRLKIAENEAKKPPPPTPPAGGRRRGGFWGFLRSLF